MGWCSRMRSATRKFPLGRGVYALKLGTAEERFRNRAGGAVDGIELDAEQGSVEEVVERAAVGGPRGFKPAGRRDRTRPPVLLNGRTKTS